MAGLEIVVRPVIFPNIRPQAPRILQSEDDPTQGIATISGQGGSLIELKFDDSGSARSNTTKEEKRDVDEVRVYQKDEETGEINRKRYFEADILRALYLTGGGSEEANEWKEQYSAMEAKDNVEVLRKGVEKIADFDG